MSVEELLAQKARLTMLANTSPTHKDRIQRLLAEIDQRIQELQGYVSDVWGIKPRNFNDMVELLRNVDPEDEKSIASANQLEELLQDESILNLLAPEVLDMISDLEGPDYPKYNKYDYSQVKEYAQSIIENSDLIQNNEYIALAAMDFHTALNSTTLFGMIRATDYGLLESAWAQTRGLEEFLEVNDYYAGELDEDGNTLTEDAFRKTMAIPKNHFRYYYAKLADLGISFTLPRYYYGRNGIPMYVGLPGMDDLGERYSQDQESRRVSFQGDSGYSVDDNGKLSRASGDMITNNESIVREGEEVVDELTYHGNDFHDDFGVMWFNEDDNLDEAEYQGRTVKLGKPMQGDVKKFKVYVRNPKGNVVKVNFGDPDMRIKKSDPEARRSFRARHNCDNPGPRHKARYWSCRKW